MSDARLKHLRDQYPPARQAQAAPQAFRPNAPVELRHLVFRQDARGARHFAVDTLFPAQLAGAVDMSGVDEGTADLLYGLVRALSPAIVLETGTHKGRSTRALATALRDNAIVPMMPMSLSAVFTPGHLWTVDAEDHAIVADGAIPPDAVSYVTPIIGWTPDVFTQTPLAELQGIEFAFLDGDHTAEGLDAELAYVDGHRAAECWVVIDNSRDAAWPGIARTLQAYTKYPRVSLATCTGLDLIWMSDVVARSTRAETAHG